MDKKKCRQLILQKRLLLSNLKSGKNISLDSLSSEALTCLSFILHFISNAEIPISSKCHEALKENGLIDQLSNVRTKQSLHSLKSRKQAINFLLPFKKVWPEILERVVIKHI